jgi:hypothetical protein
MRAAILAPLALRFALVQVWWRQGRAATRRGARAGRGARESGRKRVPKTEASARLREFAAATPREPREALTIAASTRSAQRRLSLGSKPRPARARARVQRQGKASAAAPA